MSWQASAWVADFSESRLGSRLVMMVIGHNYINGKGTHVSLHTIAQEARLSRSQTIECIKALCHTPELAIEKGRGRGRFSQYRLPLFDAAHAEIEKVRNPDLFSELKGPISVVKGPISPSKRSDLGPQEKELKKEKKNIGGSAKDRKVCWPKGLTLTEGMRQDALRLGVPNPESEFEAWRDYCKGHGSVYIDWEAAWRTRCRNYVKFNGQVKSNTQVEANFGEGIRDLGELMRKERAEEKEWKLPKSSPAN